MKEQISDWNRIELNIIRVLDILLENSRKIVLGKHGYEEHINKIKEHFRSVS